MVDGAAPSHYNSCPAKITRGTAPRREIDQDGLNSYQRALLPVIEKRKADIDENGLNSYQRALIGEIRRSKSAKYKDTNVRYQGSYEYKFLENLEITNGLEYIKKSVFRGQTIKYIKPTTNDVHLYMPDFLIENVTYEIKSGWFWDRCGRDNELRRINIAKLDAAAKYTDVVLVLDGIWIPGNPDCEHLRIVSE